MSEGGRGGGVKISAERSINIDYMHVDAVKEGRGGGAEEEKGECKIKNQKSHV